MPVLAGGEIVGRVDPKRHGRTLAAQHVSVLRPKHVPAIAAAIVEAARWVGCDNVAVERVEPASLGPSLVASVAGSG